MKQDPTIIQGILFLTLVYEHVIRLLLISECRNQRAFLDIEFLSLNWSVSSRCFKITFEFQDVNKKDLLVANSDCLMECREDLCVERHCCASRTPSLESVHVDSHGHSHKHKVLTYMSKHATFLQDR